MGTHNIHHEVVTLPRRGRGQRVGRPLPVVRMPGLMRQARQVEEDIDQYQNAPTFMAAPRISGDSQGSGSAPYGAPPATGPDHVDYGAYTGGYGAFGWYTDHPVLLGPGH